MNEPAPLSLFEGYGIELEYMIVDARTLDVRPFADRLLRDADGRPENEIERGAFAWSNELAAHVIEIKTNGPVAGLDDLAVGLDAEVREISARLAEHDARLMPTAMHPWMDPAREFVLWPHGDRTIYEAFHRIFDCRGHGWANLQSAHLNLPFADDDQLGRLHAASRAVLPLLPALAASSPFVEGRPTGNLDARLAVYRDNARRVPSVSGAVIPEPVFRRADYEALLEGIYRDLAPLDPAGTLRHEWVNARGCIVRFDRMAIEIRLLDVQETPAADVAIAAGVASVVRALCDPDARVQARLRGLETARLAALLEATIVSADETRIADGALLAALGLPRRARFARDVWAALLERDLLGGSGARVHRPWLEVILDQGCLARRLCRRVERRAGPKPDRETLRALYRELADGIAAGRPLRVEA